jgi:GTPase SAR1 family protein
VEEDEEQQRTAESHPDRSVVFAENYSTYLKEWDGLEVRVAVCGLQGTGKSSFILRYTMNDFSHYYDPTVEESCRSVVGLAAACAPLLASLILDISDTMPQYDWNDADAVVDGLILCFDVTHRASFDHIAHRLNLSLHHPTHPHPHTATHTPTSTASLFYAEERPQRIPTVIVATKMDLIQSDPNLPVAVVHPVRSVSAHEAQQLAAQYGATYIETSSLTGEGVSDAFASLIQQLIMSTYQSSPAHVPEHEQPSSSSACAVS